LFCDLRKRGSIETVPAFDQHRLFPCISKVPAKHWFGPRTPGHKLASLVDPSGQIWTRLATFSGLTLWGRKSPDTSGQKLAVSKAGQSPARTFSQFPPPTPGALWSSRRLLPMSGTESEVLQRLCALERSSSEFLRTLHTFILLDENGEYSLNLQQPESARLIDFLDEVCNNQISVQYRSTRIERLNV